MAVRIGPIRRAFVILLGAAALVVLLLLVAQDQQTLTVRSALGAEDPQYPAYVGPLVGAELSSGNRYDVLTNGDEFFPAMLAAIGTASHRVKFETYMYSAGAIARQFTDAFEAAARRGVHVVIIVDGVGSASMAADDVARLTKAGCIVTRFSVPRWYSLENINYRTHRKILAIDGEVGFTGGAGVHDQWRGDAHDRHQWRDSMIRMRGPIVRLLEAAFYENYMEAGGVVTPAVETYPPSAADTTGPSLLVSSAPTGASNNLKRLYLLSIAAARRTLDIASPYFITDASSMWSLEDAVRRGVRIRILVEGPITDAMPVKYASRHAYDRLMSLGVEMFEYQPTMMHTKVLVVDGVWSMFGSANFDNRSLELNDELNVAVWDRDLATRFLADMSKDLHVSRRLDLQTWRQRSLLDRLRERLWSAFAEVF